jgi:hypothetical protein
MELYGAFMEPLWSLFVFGPYDQLRSRAQRFCRRFGWAGFGNNKPTTHLQYDSRELTAVRRHVDVLKETGRCHKDLMGCFDEVWTCLYEPPNRVLIKQTPSQTLHTQLTGTSSINRKTTDGLERMAQDLQESLGITAPTKNPRHEPEQVSREASELAPAQGF